MKPSGKRLRTHDVVPHAGAPDFDDHAWEVIDPTTLEQRRGTGRVSFAWYRLAVTIPARIGDVDPTGATVALEVVLDDYAEIWVDGKLPSVLGQNGGNVVKGWGSPNRVILGRDVRPGQRFQIAIFGMNGPVSASPQNFIWIKSATLDVHRGPTVVASRDPGGRVTRLSPALDEIVPREPRIEKLAEGFLFTEGPLGVKLDEKDPRKSACIRCDTCDGYACLMHAKSDAQTCAVDPALAYPNVELVTNAYVQRLETSASGREVTGVVVERGGKIERYAGDIVVVSAGAINSAALLLRSASDRHPAGLANASDVVGRHYMGHTNSIVMALSRCPNPTVFQKTLALNDFYFGTEDWPFPMGHISLVGKLDLHALKAGAPAIAPGWTLELMARHSLDFWLTSEDLPDPDNRVTLNRDGRIVLSYTPNNLEGHARLQGVLKQLMKNQRCKIHGDACHDGIFSRNVFIGERIPLAGVAHQNGTIRFGRDRATSALDPLCRAHDVDNLYVVDGSFFPSSAAVNPALTIMANALRVGDHLRERMGVAGHAAFAESAGSPA